MPLINFGSILSFAEELEKQDLAFYGDAVRNEACSEFSSLFSQFSSEAQSHIKTIQRTRRENITEMIIENIEGFTRAPYCFECGRVNEMDAAAVLETARMLEDRSQRYYTAAADKMKAQKEVARVLQQIGKKHTDRRARLDTL